MKSADEFKSEWYSNWHEIDPDKSNYINFHQYCEIGDMIGETVERFLRQSNDSLKNHMLSVHILQGPEYEFTTGSRFIRWLKKKLSNSKPPERLRIVLDEYYTDITMELFNYTYKNQWVDMITPSIQLLIKKLKGEVK